MPSRHVIIHGHFYQPPRENPWIDIVETQESAAPAHDWNERVYDECYRPNCYSRILDKNGAILDIHNNYLNLSFNFGPTLFSWLEQHHVATARRIIQADAASAAALDGHGNALAQVYNHIIMPLAPRRDQLTQIRWAKHFFRERFRRDPEGMWLAETAVNMETVTCLIEEKIRFIVLSPAQADSFRPLDSTAAPAAGAGLDTRRAYRLFATDRSGNRTGGFIDVFFFNVELSREASFGDLLKDAHVLGTRVNGLFDPHASENQAVILATDGETFGHHKPFGDMCLAYFFKKIAPALNIVPVNFAYFLLKNPPRYEVFLKNAFGEGTAWSCAHGVGRWTRDCGCATGGKPGWKQQWRAPLREALQMLQVPVQREFEKACAGSGIDPWVLRDAYIEAIDDPSAAQFQKLLERVSAAPGFPVEKGLVLRKLLEAQKYLLFSFTSCGWFFADISGLEALQNLAYAARALQLGLTGELRQETLKQFAAILGTARSNIGGETGGTLFEKKILPFLAHEEIIAFTAAIEKVIGIIRTDKGRIFRTDVSLRPICSVESRHLSYHGFDITLQNEMTGEFGRWAVLVSHREWAELRGWVLAAEEFGRKLSGNVEPEHWMLHPKARSLTPADIFQSSRETMAEYIHQNIFKDTFDKFSGWMQKNEQQLDFLSRLNFPLPLYCIAPLSFVCNQQWNNLIRRLEHPGDEEKITTALRELFAMQEQFSVTIDLKESAGLLERIIIMELSALAVRLSADTCERIRAMLNIVDRFKIPVSKFKMEDMLWPVINGPIREMYAEVQRLSGQQGRSAAEQRSLESKHALCLTLVNFARRVNFNTDEFKLS